MRRLIQYPIDCKDCGATMHGPAAPVAPDGQRMAHPRHPARRTRPRHDRGARAFDADTHDRLAAADGKDD